MIRNMIPVALAVVLSACATSGGVEDDILGAMLSGESAIQGAELDEALEAASANALGSAENPVRADFPPGQRAYLSRLRCANLKAPDFARVGSMGVSPYGNIMDGYRVTCAGGEPAEQTIFMDMYHRGYVEDQAVEGYGITGGSVQVLGE